MIVFMIMIYHYDDDLISVRMMMMMISIVLLLSVGEEKLVFQPCRPPSRPQHREPETANPMPTPSPSRCCKGGLGFRVFLEAHVLPKSLIP